jgi:hypothetical protein
VFDVDAHGVGPTVLVHNRGDFIVDPAVAARRGDDRHDGIGDDARAADGIAAAGFVLTFEDQDSLARLLGAKTGRGQPADAGADHDHIKSAGSGGTL